MISDGYGSPGSIPVHGRAAFPVLIDGDNRPAVAAGRYGHGVSPTAGRAVAASHDGFLQTVTATTTRTLLVNAVEWAGKKNSRSTITVGSPSFERRVFFQNQGFAVKAVSTAMTTNSNNLSGVDVLVVNPHNEGFSTSALAQIATFAANGGGIVIGCTPWALDGSRFNSWQNILEPYGLSLSGSGTSNNTFAVASSSYPVFHSALPALDQILADATGGPAMSLADKRIAAGAVDRVLAVRPGHPELVVALDALEGPYGIISVTPSATLVKNNSPVQAMLARYQSSKFDNLPADKLFVHPSAAGWPGVPSAVTPTVSRTFTVDGNVPPDSYINWGDRGRRIDTGLYAAPGAVITVTIPANKTSGGVRLDIGCHIDENFHLASWRRFPMVIRNTVLTQAVTQTGNVFGGLIWINIPTGANLGTFDVTVEGAVEAPFFELGKHTDEDWNETLKHHPGAWGAITTGNDPALGNTPLFTIYVSRRHLQNVASAEAVATHWKTVMETADHYMGYGEFRKRGESALSDIDILAGGGHAGFPVMMAYGDSDSLVNGTVQGGDWGFYHEIGHTFQDSFDGTYGIATHGEVDVNLVPGLLYTHVHDRTAWDGNVHSTFNAPGRQTDRNAFLALAADQRTWAAACSGGRPMAYDFYFNLAEAFGWEAYRKALRRLMAWQQGGSDPALANLAGGGEQGRRNRFYTIFCDATGRDLDAYFQRYGLGVSGLGFEISASAKSAIAAKGYPAWIDNSQVDGIEDPGPINVPDSLPVGSIIASLEAVDPEEPGTLWEWDIVSGNANGRIVIDRRSGVLRVGPLGLDRDATASHSFTVRARDGGVPRSEAQRQIAVGIDKVIKYPRAASYDVLRATTAMAANTVLGQVIVGDSSLSLATTTIVSGNGSGAFGLDTTGRLILQNPTALPAASVVTLVVSATDSAGVIGFAPVRVLVNATRGLREQRWTGQTRYSDQDWTGTPNFAGHLNTSTTAQNVGDNYSRRITGWVVAPQSGLYTIWVASDDDSRLLLGTDASEFSKIQRASVGNWTNFQAFDAQSSQRSAGIFLEAGKAYWFDAQQRESGGGDHLSVAWSKPDGSARQIIPTQNLIPNQPGVSGMAPFPMPPSFHTPTISLDGVVVGDPLAGSLVEQVSQLSNGGNLIFTKVSGPTWLQVATDGTLSGSPGTSDGGPNWWTIRVTNSDGLYSETQLSLMVTGAEAVVFVSSPSGSQVMAPGSPVVLAASAYAGDFLAQSVQFRVNGNLVGTATGEPWQVSWVEPTVGEHSVAVRLIHSGGSVESDSVNFFVLGDERIWTNPNGGSWLDEGNWLAGLIGEGTTRIADFSTLDLAADCMVALNGDWVIAGLRFGDISPSHDWTLAPGSGGVLTLSSQSGIPVLEVAEDRTTIISVVVGGTQGWEKAGEGSLTVSGNGTWTGTTTVSEGSVEVLAKTNDVSYVVAPGATLKFGYNSGLGYSPSHTIHGAGTESPAGLHILAGRTLASNGGVLLDTAPSTIRSYGTGTASLRGFDVNNTFFLRNTAAASGSVVAAPVGIQTGFYGYRLITDAGSATLTGDLTVHGVISGTGVAQTAGMLMNTGLTKWGAGSLHLTGASTFAGAIAINQGCIILSGGNERLPAGTTVVLGNGANSAKLALAGVSQTIADLRLHGTEGTTNAVVGAAPALSTLIIALNGDRTFSGALGGTGEFENNLGLTKSGPGALTLDTAHTHTGPTRITDGTLVLLGTLANSSVRVEAGATFAGIGFSGESVVLEGGTLSPAGAGVGTLSIGGTLEFGPDSALEIQIVDWSTAPGLGHDQIQAASASFAAIESSPLVVRISGPPLPDPISYDRTVFPVLETTNGVVGFRPDLVRVESSGFVGTWTTEIEGNTLMLVYSPPSSPPQFNGSIDLGSFAAEAPLSVSLAAHASDPNPRDIPTFTLSGEADWLEISSEGVLSGTPGLSEGRATSFILRATDSEGLFAETTVNLTVTLTAHQQWRLDSFGEDAGDLELTSDLNDPDGDGIPNLIEFALGLEPRQPGTIGIIHSWSEVGGQRFMTLEVNRNPAASDLVFTVEVSNHPGDPTSWSVLETEILVETPARLVVRDTEPGPKRFIRLRVGR